MKVSGNGRYFVDGDGRPFFYLADTAWALLYKPTLAEAEAYLRNRKDKGFTVIMPVVLWKEDTKPLSPDGEPPLVDWDPTRPNEAFFRHVDAVVDKACDLGLHMAILPTWGEFVGPLFHGMKPREGFDPSKYGPEIFTPRSARVYGEFLGRRYGDREVFWVLGGDRLPVEERHKEIWRAMAEGLDAGDGGRGLMTYHPCGSRCSSEFFHEEPWLDFNMMQTTTRWDLDNYELILRDYNRTPVKPVLDGEARYEDSYEFFSATPRHGRRITPAQVRKAAWNAMLSGACGHTYGCRDVWFFYIPSDEPPTKDVKTCWKKAMDFPGVWQMGRLRELLTRYPWHKLVPDQQRRVVVQGCGTGGTYTPAALADDRSFALVYVPERIPVWVDTAVLGGAPVLCRWFDPRTGSYQWERESRTPGVERFDPPDRDTDPDYVLVLERAD